MEPETQKLIASWPDMTEEQAKLLFIRQSATKAFENGNILEATKEILAEIVKVSTVSNMTKAEIAVHIGNLEKARTFLAAFTQGLMIGQANEEEPRIKEKHKKEQREKVLAKVKSNTDKRVNELIEMARNASIASAAKPKAKVEKQTCPTCGESVFSLKFHTCKVK